MSLPLPPSIPLSDRAVACRAGVRCGLVEKHSPIFDRACGLVAGIATDVRMSALQWKVGLRLVVEE